MVINNQMIDVVEKLVELGAAPKDDLAYINEQIEAGNNFEVYELEEAKRYLEVLQEAYD